MGDQSTKQKLLIIIPTFNEFDNISLIYDGIRQYLPQANILFVDDNSDDGTSDLIREIMEINKNVFLLNRIKKNGIASAYIDGFEWGLKNSYDFFLQMDCDLSHDPKYLPVFESQIKQYDVVIGSRYVSGGGIINWNFRRKMISRLGSLYSRIILCIPIKDLTGGFNCWSREVLRKINLANLISNGFSFQIEMKYIAIKNKFEIKEIPILFKEREHGVSKMKFKIILEGLYKVLMFRFIHR